MLEFHDDALILSGLTGTQKKCQIIGEYYPLWWEITSGGPRQRHRFSTAIVDMNAGTGEDYIEETHETILGSSGHALRVKIERSETSELKVVLVESDKDCYHHLRNVMRKKWSTIPVDSAEGPIETNKCGVYLLN